MLNNKYKNITKVEAERRIFFEAQRPQEIWKELIEHDIEDMKKLCTAMSKLVYEVGLPKFVVHLSAKILYNSVYRWWGHYKNESDYLAHQCTNMSASLMAFLQRQYTLAHMGCSVVMSWDEENKEMLCFRSLDWQGADDIAKSTRRFLFVNKKDKEVAQVAGITAMVGVLTGAKKGFSIAINYAPWKRSAAFASDPTFLIRQLLEDEGVNDYKSALAIVSAWKVGSPCFISLCGVNKGEACVIELGSKNQVHVREMENNDFLIQTNHYDLETSPFIQHNEEAYRQEMTEKEWFDSELLKNSQKREALLRKKLQDRPNVSRQEQLINMYLEVPILNWETAQWVLMRPKSGEIEIYACVDK